MKRVLIYVIVTLLALILLGCGNTEATTTIVSSTISSPVTSVVTTTPAATSTTQIISSTTTDALIYTDGKVEVRGNGEPIVLKNNPQAKNPTYSELLTFLEADITDCRRLIR
jgi:PBP1b-binding outer membrane lipoprotein LpoB